MIPTINVLNCSWSGIWYRSCLNMNYLLTYKLITKIITMSVFANVVLYPRTCTFCVLEFYQTTKWHWNVQMSLEMGSLVKFCAGDHFVLSHCRLSDALMFKMSITNLMPQVWQCLLVFRWFISGTLWCWNKDKRNWCGDLDIHHVGEKCTPPAKR